VLLRDIASLVGGKCYGGKTFNVSEIQPPEDATSHDLTFLFNPQQKTGAGAVIAKQRITKKPCIVVSDAKQALYALLKHMNEQRSEWGLSSQTDIASTVQLPSHCCVESFVVIKQGVVIGQGAVIGAHSYIGEGVTIGSNVTIAPHVSILPGTVIKNHVAIGCNTVIGKQGFGFIKRKRFHRIPHIGGVVVEPFVEIGGSVTIDRATIGKTMIGRGTKIDNLVHIGHNVIIGRNCIIMGQVGIAGSANIGDNVTLCGQVGVSDHVNIGDNVIVYAKSAVFKSIPARRIYSGIPAREHHAVLRALGRLYRGT